MNRFNRIYVSGCSHTRGGGLDNQNIMDLYAKRGIIYKDPSEVAYPRHLSAEFNIELIDESMFGTGAIRLIRDAYNFIERIGIDEAKKTLFVLQFNESPIRISHWSNHLSAYGNIFITSVKKKDARGNAMERWVKMGNWIEEQLFNNDKLVNTIVKDLYNPVEYSREIKKAIIGFLSYLMLNDIQHVFTLENMKNEEVIGLDLSLNRFHPDGENSIYKYSLKHKILLEHVFLLQDNHPSIQAHQEYANLLINHIKEKFKIF